MHEGIVALISGSGVIISTIVSFIIGEVKSKTELNKIHSKFNRKLYSKRLKAYLKIAELVSGFLKVVRRKGISCKQLNNFYKEYSDLDSKSSLLFSYTNIYSGKLMDEIKKILSCHKKAGIICDDSKVNLKKKLVDVELSMKYELDVFEYKKPGAIIKNSKKPESYQEAETMLNEKQHKRKW